MKCPACKVDMEPLVAGIFQCPQCKKIIKEKDDKTEEEAAKKHDEGDFQDGEYGRIKQKIRDSREGYHDYQNSKSLVCGFNLSKCLFKKRKVCEIVVVD